jgi:hypothetical protein
MKLAEKISEEFLHDEKNLKENNHDLKFFERLNSRLVTVKGFKLSYLINMLKESPINKQLIAETIIRMGIEGENNLLLMMNSEPDSNYKLKSAVIRSYSYADITSPNIDFILESIFKLGNNEFPSVRKACIFTIHELASRANENITYLKKKNIIPYY